MTQKLFNKLYDGYYDDYRVVFTEDALDYPNVESMIEDDLVDKGFTKEEITSIMDRNINEPKTAYKFVAYAIYLYNDFSTEEELEELCEELDILDELTNDDIKNIVMMSYELF